MLSNGERCKECYFFRPDLPSAEECHGDCLRYPPQTLPLDPAGKREPIETVEVKIILNRTHSTFACGEFRDRALTIAQARPPAPGAKRH